MSEFVRIEIGFDGGQSLSMLVSAESADELANGVGQDGSVTLEAEDAKYIVALRRVVYLRRSRRDPKVGFGVS